MHTDELANAVTEAEAKAPEDLTEQDKMALLGRPKSGDIVRAQLRIKESKEFKVCLFCFVFDHFVLSRFLFLFPLFACDSGPNLSKPFIRTPIESNVLYTIYVQHKQAQGAHLF